MLNANALDIIFINTILISFSLRLKIIIILIFFFAPINGVSFEDEMRRALYEYKNEHPSSTPKELEEWVQEILMSYKFLYVILINY